jgi:deferrochelatase/peroxidase EfeB
MTDKQKPSDDSPRLSRKRLLAAAAATGLVASTEGVARAAEYAQPATVALGAQPKGLPVGQHVWPALKNDAGGNPVGPTYNRLLFFDVLKAPTVASVRTLEAALRTVERAYPWNANGVMFTVSWGPHYFEKVLKVTSPIPHPQQLSDFEYPIFDGYDVCIHLASDDEKILVAIQNAFTAGAALPGGAKADLSGIFRWRETRTGFAGDGVPAAHQTNVTGIPAGGVVPATSPLFMGFKSGYVKNQATEDSVTITSGDFAGGTTQHVSYIRLKLDRWYGGMSQNQRVQLMFGPQITPDQVNAFKDDPQSKPEALNTDAVTYGMVGHAQAAARARTTTGPVIIRRDFDTVDGGVAGLHFVAVQKSIDDFVTMRQAMNATNAPRLNPVITATANNGINEFMFVLRRANYIVPPRAKRSFPLFAYQSQALSS